jgi:hypothetical protein
MTQFVKPIGDKVHASWTGNNVGGSNLYQEVDETVASTDDFTSYDVATAAGNSDGPIISWLLTSLSGSAPGGGTATVRFRTYASQTCQYYMEIYSGYVDESNKGTLLATTSTQSHPGDGAWHTHTDSAVTFSADPGSGATLVARLHSHSTSGSSTTIAITALDADLPASSVNLSGTPDLLATTPMTGSGSGTVQWRMTGTPELLGTALSITASGTVQWRMSGTAALTVLTGSGTMTTAQGQHFLTDGAPNLTRPTATGVMTTKWVLTGSFELTPITATGQETASSTLHGGLIDLLPLFFFSGLAAPVIKREFTDIRAAADVAQEYVTESLQGRGHTFVIFRNFLQVTGGPSGSKYTIFYIVEPLVPHEDLDRAGLVIARQIIARRLELTEQGTVYSYDTDDPGYTFIQPQQDLSPKRPCPAADPVNADGDRTERVSYYSRDLKVVKHE